jgi:hypothetical protein
MIPLARYCAGCFVRATLLRHGEPHPFRCLFKERFHLDISCLKEPERQAWTQRVLAREIELEEIDTQPYRDRYGPNSVQVTRAQAAE